MDLPSYQATAMPLLLIKELTQKRKQTNPSFNLFVLSLSRPECAGYATIITSVCLTILVSVYLSVYRYRLSVCLFLSFFLSFSLSFFLSFFLFSLSVSLTIFLAILHLFLRISHAQEGEFNAGQSCFYQESLISCFVTHFQKTTPNTMG